MQLCGCWNFPNGLGFCQYLLRAHALRGCTGLVSLRSTGSDLEGALFTAAVLGIASFLVTGPLTAAQLRLAPRPQLSFKAHAILYYTTSGPTFNPFKLWPFQALSSPG
jgi:hypothetical protein